MQYTSRGHVLGFDSSGYYVSNGTYALRVSFENARLAAPSATDAVGAGADRKAAPLNRVTYSELWHGISAAYDAPQGGVVRSTWTLQPGANPAAIRLRYNRAVKLNETTGELRIPFATGTVSESRPVAWQEVDGVRAVVQVAFAQHADDLVGFRVGAYRSDLPLTIDPTLTWNNFLGFKEGTDFGDAIALDGSGNVYITGNSQAPWGDPLNPFTGGSDAFVAKLTSAGMLTWSTFLGGGSTDYGHAIFVDAGGNVYVAGQSGSTWGSPVRAFAGGNTDAFIAKLTSAGALSWNTFLGAGAGSLNDHGEGIAVDASGNVYVTGSSEATWGSPLRAYAGGGLDAFVAKLTSGGALSWNTFLGGGGIDVGSAIAVDASAKVYVAGRSSATWGSPVRGYTSLDDAFAAKLTSTGALTWHTFLGGSSFDDGYGIAVDSSGNVFVVGHSPATWGNPVITKGDEFVAKLNSSGVLTWNALLAGDGSEDESAIALDASGNAYITGTDGSDAFVFKLPSEGGVTWNTLLGEGNAQGRGIALDATGNVYVAGMSQDTWGTPVRPYSSNGDAFVAKLTAAGALTWNTFLGGGPDDYANAIAVDGSGNLYIAGSVATSGGQAFAAKCTPAGVLSWTRLMGGGGVDEGHAIAVDGSGSVYVAGYSDASWGGPVRVYVSAGDAFVAKLTSSGGIFWNTFLGGSGVDIGNAVAVDSSGNVYVAGDSGATWGSPVRVYSSGGDAFAAKLTSTGSLIWNTFLGGSGIDAGHAITVDGLGIVYVVGDSSSSWGSPVRPLTSFGDAYAVKLTATGGLSWNTFLGGTGSDRGWGVVVDGGGNLYVAGDSSAGWGSPVRAYTTGIVDAFAAKVAPTGTLTWNTFLGGSGLEVATSIAMGGDGSLYVAGYSTATWGVPVAVYSSGYDGFATKLTPAGGLAWSTFLGGNGDDRVQGIALDGSGNIYTTGYSDVGWGSPIVPHTGNDDAFVAQMPVDVPTPTATSTPTATNTPTPTLTPTDTATDTPTPVPTATDSPPATVTATPTGTETSTHTATTTPTYTPTKTPSSTPTQTPTSSSTPVPGCGNTIIEAGEQCDDGNTAGGDCCSSTCLHDAIGSACASDGDPCTVDQCDGAGVCTHLGNGGCENANSNLPPGGNITTDPEADGATPSDPVETTITSPTGGTIAIQERPFSGSPSSFFAYGNEIEIDAPPATATNPLVITFRLDASIIFPQPFTQAYIDIGYPFVIKDAAIVARCMGALGVASPDPCVQSRALQPDGDVTITVLTSTASVWQFAVPSGECPETVDSSCVTGFEKAFLMIKGSVPGKAKLVGKLIKGPAVTQTDLGNPLYAAEGGTGTVVSFCIYEENGDLAGEVIVGKAASACADDVPCWSAIGAAPNAPNGPGKGYAFKDADGAAAGVQKLLYKGGDAGKSKAIIKAKGANIPVGIAAALEASAQVTIQLRSSDGECLSATLDEIKKQTSESFKAK